MSLGLPGILGIVFIILKLLGKITWPWIWVTCPIWIPFSIILTVLGISLLATFILMFYKGGKR